MQITKKYLQEVLRAQTTEFNKRFDKIDQRFEMIDKKIDQQSKELKGVIEKETANLAGMVNRRFEEVINLLDVRGKVEEHEKKIIEIRHALNLKP